jgi:hypothetical protein
MRLTPVSALTAIVCAAALGAVVPNTATAAARPASNHHDHHHPTSYTFAVIGDVPYGADQVAAFPGWVDQISADRDVRLVTHVGDVKNGSTVCSNDYFAFIRAQFDRFDTPLVYTPGDNEWTDCHRTNNGAYDPYERLDAVRRMFFPEPGVTLAEPMRVDNQKAFPENVDWHAARITFAAVHVVGSNNGMAPWTGATTANERQVAEVAARTRANIKKLREAFHDAKRRDDRAVVVFQQADMFDPTFTPTFNDVSAFKPWVQALTDEAADFDGPVYLFDGDSHVYNADHPLATGSTWLGLHGVTGAADNLTRITVDGSSNNKDWLKVAVQRHGPEVLTWEQVPYS